MSDLYHVIKTMLLLSALLLIYKCLRRNFDYWKKKGVPYITPIPLVGNFADALTFRATIANILWDMYKKMESPFFGIWVFHKPHLVVKDPELIKNILVKDFKYFCDRNSSGNVKADPIVAHVLFLVKNPEWKILRNKMTPVFTLGKIKGMIPIMNEVGENLRNYLTKLSSQNTSLETKEICSKFTTDILTSCAFGLQGRSFECEDAPFRRVGRELFEFNVANAIRTVAYFLAPCLLDIFKIKFMSDNVTNFLKETFWHTISERELNNIRRNDLIDLIIKLKNEDVDGNELEGDKVVAQAVQFFIAGFETTSSTMAFTLYEMCLNDRIQQKVRAEIKSALKAHGGVTYEALQHMKYLHKIVSETLRKYPVLAFLDRCCMEDYKIPGTNVILEKGTPVFIPMFGLHHDPKYFPDPERFDPERFSEENINSRPTYTYIPFGSGPHNCIGEADGERFGLTSTKLGLVHILSQFEVHRSETTPVPLKFAKKTVIIATENGIPMRFIDIRRRISIAA